MSVDIEAIARELDAAVLEASPIDQFEGRVSFSLAQAYEIQSAGVQLRADRGDQVVGVKLGFTSKEKAAQMGVADVIFGRVTASMQIMDGEIAPRSEYIHPRIEPEVAFLLGRDVDLADPSDDPLTAVEAVAPALEIIDSRYQNFKFSLNDVVADNTSACGFAVGPWTDFASVSRLGIANAGVVVSQNGAVALTGSTGAILGNPLRALAAAKRMAHTYSIPLPAGTILLAGAATEAMPLAANSTIEARIAGLGSVSISVEGESR